MAAAKLIVPSYALPFANFQGTIAQSLRPFPQYGGIGDPYGNVGQVNYHALQASLQQRLSNGLTFNINYTYSKGHWQHIRNRSAYRGQLDRTISNTGSAARLRQRSSPMTCRSKPGKGSIPATRPPGRCLVAGPSPGSPGSPRAYRSDRSSARTLPQAGTCYVDYDPTFTGPVRINGDWGDAARCWVQ